MTKQDERKAKKTKMPALAGEKEVAEMPYGNGTGPDGLGPMTGRGAGYCAGYNTPGYLNPVGGRRGYGAGYGRGGGFGRGYGAGYGRGGYWRGAAVAPYAPAPAAPTYSAVSEESVLKDQISFLEEQLKAAQARVAELGNAKKDVKKK